jgi:tetratricopeptide (TPR) repeat protein
MSAIEAPDTLAETDSLAGELIRVGHEIGDDNLALRGHIHRFFAGVVAGDVGSYSDDLEQAAEIAARLRSPTDLWQVAAMRAMLAIAAGRLDEAEALITTASEPGAQAQPDMAVPITVMQRYALGDLRDDLNGFDAELEELALAFPARPVFKCALAHLHARTGRTGQAAAELARLGRDGFAAIPFDAEWLYALSLLAEVASLTGDVAAAERLYELLLPWRHVVAADPPEGIRGSVSHDLGLLAAALGRRDDAERHFEAALGVEESLGFASCAARTRAELARTT